MTDRSRTAPHWKYHSGKEMCLLMGYAPSWGCE